MPADEEQRGRELARRFGDNVRRYRELRDMSQSDLAREMTARGHSWHQSTTYKTEYGERRTDAPEIYALAEILGVTIDRLYWPAAEATELALADDAITRVRRSWLEVSNATVQLLASIEAGKSALASARASKYQRVRDAGAELDTEIKASPLESAVSDGMARHENPED
jgi:transcriptional regulator with XRE-family HTH domain